MKKRLKKADQEDRGVKGPVRPVPLSSHLIIEATLAVPLQEGHVPSSPPPEEWWSLRGLRTKAGSLVPWSVLHSAASESHEFLAQNWRCQVGVPGRHERRCSLSQLPSVSGGAGVAPSVCVKEESFFFFLFISFFFLFFLFSFLSPAFRIVF